MGKLLTQIKLRAKRLYRFCTKGGLNYLSWAGSVKALQWHMNNGLQKQSCKKIYWIGPFSPIHANVGDHAQTLGVQNFLCDKFSDYKIIRIYRDDITVKVLSDIAKQLRKSDLVFLQSSGDFGSLHDVSSHHPGRISYPEVRRQIVKMAQASKVINLPVTAFYEDNEQGVVSLDKDRTIFNGSKFIILCREPISLQTVQKNLTCKSMFFPDFVFYLKPKPYTEPRSGVRVILRRDKEAMLSVEQKEMLSVKLSTLFSDVNVEDIMHEFHVIPDSILEKYMDNVLQKFQQQELIITDKMHGMITAVITQTPCIALSGGIPHKISAYKSFLSGAVEFVDDVSDIEDAIKRIRKQEYSPVDLSSYFETFRTEVAGL